ncbi:hypothetical protein M408DRAFT_100313 [Serendipita vermifera MAFF 305830]|uniref:F-box domain-containing protein n=1 Tax=Serendipita vermifera MAFF 305830 TaxID=933852 RepID=A0A0C2XM34_SERVB|nr:hypothetical protein M408DRAFT_100313 [Serendipita vermifera MAFF 305830]
MTSLSILPVELWLDIIDILKPSYPDAPVTGVNAAWTKLTSVCYLPPEYPGDRIQLEPWATANQERQVKPRVRSALWDLRLVCKEMDALCTPFLLQELNLLEQDPDMLWEMPTTFAQHIQSMRILLDPFSEEESELEPQYHKRVAQLLGQCPNLSSIALYYRDSATSIALMQDEIFSLLNEGKIHSFGIYSILVLHQDVGSWLWNHIYPTAPSEILEKLHREPHLTQAIRNLDIVAETLTPNAYDAVRMCFPALQRLTLRRGIRSYLGRIWDPDQCNKWHPKPNLTHFHIIDCLAGYAPHIPEIVRHFRALKYLVISTCGDEDDIQPFQRPQGWSSQPDALCQTRSHLESVHIEHMEGWEIRALGIIPTKSVMLSNILSGHFVRALDTDPEIFPGLETIHVLPLYGSDSLTEEDKKLKEIFDSLCKRRKIKVTAEGYHIKPSSGIYGFA